MRPVLKRPHCSNNRRDLGARDDFRTQLRAEDGERHRARQLFVTGERFDAAHAEGLAAHASRVRPFVRT